MDTAGLKIFIKNIDNQIKNIILLRKCKFTE